MSYNYLRVRVASVKLSNQICTWNMTWNLIPFLSSKLVLVNHVVICSMCLCVISKQYLRRWLFPSIHSVQIPWGNHERPRTETEKFVDFHWWKTQCSYFLSRFQLGFSMGSSSAVIQKFHNHELNWDLTEIFHEKSPKNGSLEWKKLNNIM